MGGGASIDGEYSNNFNESNESYENVKASGVQFNVAYETIKEKYQHTKSASSSLVECNRTNMVVDQDLTTIHFLAIRQLSYNLRNQDMLLKSRKFMMSKSLNNMANEADLNEESSDDRIIINNDANEIRHTRSQNAILHENKLSIDKAMNSSRHSEVISSLNRINEMKTYVVDELCHEDLMLVHDEDYNYRPTAKKAADDNIAGSNTSTIATDVVVASTDSSNNGPLTKKTNKKPKPNLSLLITTDHSLSSNDIIMMNNSQQSINQSHDSHSHSVIISPNSSMHLSPRGTLHLGKLKVMETGIHQSAKALNTSSGSNKLTSNGSFRKAPTATTKTLSAISGKREFIEINALGAGASGVVVEAIHIPSLTIVALKMLPVYNREKRKHVSRELEVLYKNLTELRLVDDSLRDNDTSSNSSNNNHNNSNSSLPSCRNIVSLYNAFIDPTSGLINLVIEYMDGGSLEDLVRQGGCSDERILADIAYQTCKGLSFLHENKHVHRDIKPANILCSTSGHIKIADFGVAKALDNTSAFAHSFIGTVCYMSPERIIGESPYSFPCDVWSLGLTLLAVAKGRFPLVDREDGDGDDDSPKYKQAAGGAVGYWAMIKAICDDDPPTAGADFSYDFNQFIASCLHKQPIDRLTAKELLSTPLVKMNQPVLKLTKSDLHMRYASMYKTGSLRRSLQIDTDIDEDTESHFDNLSPLTKRLNDAAVNVNRNSVKSDPIFPGYNQHHLSHNNNNDHNNNNSLEDEEVTIAASVNAIRLTHLDRVLDRIVKRVNINSEPSSIGFEDSLDDFDIDDTDDRDLLDVHSFNDDSFMIDRTKDSSNSNSSNNNNNNNSLTSVSTSSMTEADDKAAVPLSSSSASKNDTYSNDSKNNTISTDSKRAFKLLLVEEEEKKSRCLPCVPEAEEKDDFFAPQVPSFASFSAMETDDLDIPSVGMTMRSHEHAMPSSSSLVHASLIPHKSVHFLDLDSDYNSLSTSKSSEDKTTVTAANIERSSTSQLQQLQQQHNQPLQPQQRKTSIGSNVSSSNNSSTSDLLNPMYYRQILPKLDRSGEQKWENLAQQLHLPLSLVKLAVRDKLGKVFNIGGDSDF